MKARAELERDALKKAVEDARARADAMAGGAGKTIAGIVRIEEQRQVDGGPRPMAMARAAMMKDEAVATPVAAGEIEIKASVTAVFALQ